MIYAVWADWYPKHLWLVMEWLAVTYHGHPCIAPHVVDLCHIVGIPSRFLDSAHKMDDPTKVKTWTPWFCQACNHGFWIAHGGIGRPSCTNSRCSAYGSPTRVRLSGRNTYKSTVQPPKFIHHS